MGEDNYSLVVQGLARFRVLDLVQETPYLKARIEPVDDKTSAENVEVEALGINLKKLAREVIELMPELPAAATELVDSITHPGHLADLIAANVDVPIEEKQAVLETVDLKARMKLVLELLNRKREILKLSNKIDSAVKGEMSKTQREYYLRQQLKAIKEELGEMGEEEEELDELEERLKKAGLPPEVEKVATRGAQPPQDHARRPRASTPSSAPTSTGSPTCRGAKTSEDNLDIENARATLDDDHYGLEKVKKRILEYLAVRKLKNDMKGPILCFVGPPGVGKTSLGQSIARSARPQVRPHLARRRARRGGDPRPPAHLRRRAARPHHPGHEEGRARRTRSSCSTRSTSSARTSAAIRRRRCSRCSTPSRTTPSAITTSTCRSTSRRCCSSPPRTSSTRSRRRSATAWRSSSSPATPTTRSGRSPSIHLVPKQLEEHGLTADAHRDRRTRRCDTSSTSYTREAGVRSLEREIADVCRAVAVEVAAGEDRPSRSITADQVDEDPRSRALLLARSRSAPRCRASPPASPGRPSGGDILFIEATQMAGKGGMTLTGQLGDVMKESAQAALSYVRSKARAARHRQQLPREDATSTSTSRRAASPRTARRPA